MQRRTALHSLLGVHIGATLHREDKLPRDAEHHSEHSRPINPALQTSQAGHAGPDWPRATACPKKAITVVQAVIPPPRSTTSAVPCSIASDNSPLRSCPWTGSTDAVAVFQIRHLAGRVAQPSIYFSNGGPCMTESGSHARRAHPDHCCPQCVRLSPLRHSKTRIGKIVDRMPLGTSIEGISGGKPCSALILAEARYQISAHACDLPASPAVLSLRSCFLYHTTIQG